MHKSVAVGVCFLCGALHWLLFCNRVGSICCEWHILLQITGLLVRSTHYGKHG